jgi:Tfp pilus assembly protein PilV
MGTVMLYSKKKAQSIIEVMVAMTLITVVLGSTFALIMRAVSLVMVAQSRTEAIEIAQKGLAETVLVLQDGCGISADTTYTRLNKTVNGKQLTITKTASGLADFDKITATVEWDDRGMADQTIAISQLVRVAGTP